MARQSAAVELNRFNAGLVTDASPLTFPDNSSQDEENMVLNIDGSRNRRLGMSFEQDFEEITTTIADADTIAYGNTTFKWTNAGGDPEKELLVVQYGTEVKIFDLDSLPISANLLSTQTFVGAEATQQFSFAVVDGVLVIVTGEKPIYTLTYESPSTFTLATSRLLIRDLFGLEDIDSTVDITRGNDVQNRPTTLSNEHRYNLRNQGWGIPRVVANTEVVNDPITAFFADASVYPANSDSVLEALYPDASDTDDRLVDRFFADDLRKNPLGTSRTAMGFFVIDALDRGASRLEEYSNNQTRYSTLDFPASAFPEDITPAGPTCVSEYAGRAFYAGFPGEVTDGDSYSPKMSSYVLFSQVVNSTADLTLCYQAGDPTSRDGPDVIDTDGGYIRLNGAYGILALIGLGSGLFVVAKNGVWRIVGGTDNGFTATSYIVERISDRGCTNANSIVVVDNTIIYWGDDAIYHVHPDQFGSWVCENIITNKIQRLYDEINIEDKRHAAGAYDSFERKARWVYQTRLSDTDNETKELVLDFNLKAFYINRIYNVAAGMPRVVSIFPGQPYQIDLSQEQVVCLTDDVEVSTDEVFITLSVRSGISRRELTYLVITDIDPVVVYTFSAYSDTDFIDWVDSDGVGVDAFAFVLTGQLTGSDNQRNKGVPYLVAHMRRTETGFELDGDGDLVPQNPSSVYLQARWDWSNSINSGKWSRAQQVYRYRHYYLPVDSDDPYDTGFETIFTRNKIRGMGKAVSLYWYTEPLKDFHLYGWSMIFDMGTQP